MVLHAVWYIWRCLCQLFLMFFCNESIIERRMVYGGGGCIGSNFHIWIGVEFSRGAQGGANCVQNVCHLLLGLG